MRPAAPARRRGPRLGRCGLAAGAVLAAACGYTAGLGVPAPGIRTVAIRVSGNESFRQRLEIPLTRRLHEEVPYRTGLRIAAHDSADAILIVTIVDARGRALVTGGREPLTEGALELAVDAVLVDRRSGTELRRLQIADRAEYRIPIGEGLESAVSETAGDLARKIALGLEDPF